ncbi:T9SS type A sorting domain-containing protein [Tamlana sp. I1]|uniref:T9SS type A sorting domain-containing protein n=1 Tax=Tamlana sp. I1 TaxID=2762061 RepID=UPI001890216B|nr:T9SS type A sorting domain-containing protein [Tamlana sp. I1]
MKKITLQLFCILFMCVYSTVKAQSGTETFANLSLTNEYVDGSFVGDNSITWNYFQARTDTSGTLDGIMLRDDATAGQSVLSTTLPGGIKSLTFDLAKAFNGTNNADATVSIYLNSTLIGTSEEVGSRNMVDPYKYIINNISGYDMGPNTLEIRANVKPIIIVEISWSDMVLSNNDFNPSLKDSKLQLQPSLLTKGSDLNINLELNNYNKTTEISIYSISGKLLRSRNVKQNNTTLSIVENIPFASGLYILKVKNGNTIKTSKFMVK